MENQNLRNEINAALKNRMEFLTNNNGKRFWTSQKSYDEYKEAYENKKQEDFPNFPLYSDTDKEKTDVYQVIQGDRLDEKLLELLNECDIGKKYIKVGRQPKTPFIGRGVIENYPNSKELKGKPIFQEEEGNQRVIENLEKQNGEGNSCFWWYKYGLTSHNESPISVSVFIHPDKVRVTVENHAKKSNSYSSAMVNALEGKEIEIFYKPSKVDYDIEIEKAFLELKGKYKELMSKETILKLKIGEALSEKKQIVLTGAPGTGKTHTAREYAEEMVKITMDKTSEVNDVEKEIKKRIKFVQFHPSMDYTDFVEGLKPIQLANEKAKADEKAEYSFVRVDGIFKSFCREIIKNGDNGKEECPYFFIIDEINRADLSKVFGELMYGLEESYRDKKPYPQSQYSYLPTYYIGADGLGYQYGANGNPQDDFKDGFYIPMNLYIIGTMNDIDRSVESFDFALRRRFKWIDVKADEVMKDVLSNMFEKNEEQKCLISNIKEIVDNINNMNEVISGELGRKLRLSESFHIGPSYFKNLKPNSDGKVDYDKVFQNYVRPILVEYTRSQNGTQLQEDFLSECQKKLNG